MTKPMTISDRASEAIRRHEGLRLDAYLCPAGVLTIGYGHTGAVKPKQKITEDDAMTLFGQDIAVFEEGVAELVTRPHQQGAFDAFVSLAFNIGLAAFARSTALRRYNAGDVAGAAEALQWWNKARVNGQLRPLRGLTKRRAEEADWLLEEIEADVQDAPRQGLVETATAPAAGARLLTAGGPIRTRPPVESGPTADDLNRRFLERLRAKRRAA